MKGVHSADCIGSIPTELVAGSWADLSCDEQFTLATQIAANIGYVLKPEPPHPDCPHSFPQPRLVRRGLPLWAGLVAGLFVVLCAAGAAVGIATAGKATTASPVGIGPLADEPKPKPIPTGEA